MKKWRVGVFDSGVGGLTVLHECQSLLHGCSFYYLGDNTRAPYGSRSPEEIVRFVGEGLCVFEEIGVDAAVLACNTATTVCVGRMRKRFSFPVVGTEPALLPAARLCRRVLLLSTPRTAESERLKGLLSACPPSCRVFVAPCERLASAVERAVAEGDPLLPSGLLPPPPAGGVDGVVLGCTHYVFFRNEIASFYKAKVFDGNRGTALRLKEVLQGKKLGKTGMDDHFSGEKNTNKRFHAEREYCAKNELIFLGLTKNINKICYEHMFDC